MTSRQHGGVRSGGAAKPPVRVGGPYDADDIDPLAGPEGDTVDFGSVRVPVPSRGSVTLEPVANGRLQAVHVAVPEGRLSISALAAPRSSTLWPELVKEIDASLREGGARVRSYTGDWGRELHATTDSSTSVFVGADGPRWMVYGVATGPTRDAVALDAELRRMMRGTVVVRGGAPYPARTVLPLVVPDHLKAAAPTPPRSAIARPAGTQRGGLHEGAPAEAAENRPPDPAAPAPDRLVPDRVTLDRVGLDQPVPDRVVPDRLVPDRVTLDRVGLDQPVPDRVVPDRLVPDRVTPDRDVPDRVALDRASFGHLAQDGSPYRGWPPPVDPIPAGPALALPSFRGAEVIPGPVPALPEPLDPWSAEIDSMDLSTSGIRRPDAIVADADEFDQDWPPLWADVVRHIASIPQPTVLDGGELPTDRLPMVQPVERSRNEGPSDGSPGEPWRSERGTSSGHTSRRDRRRPDASAPTNSHPVPLEPPSTRAPGGRRRAPEPGEPSAGRRRAPEPVIQLHPGRRRAPDAEEAGPGRQVPDRAGAAEQPYRSGRRRKPDPGAAESRSGRRRAPELPEVTPRRSRPIAPEEPRTEPIAVPTADPAGQAPCGGRPERSGRHLADAPATERRPYPPGPVNGHRAERHGDRDGSGRHRG